MIFETPGEEQAAKSFVVAWQNLQDCGQAHDAATVRAVAKGVASQDECNNTATDFDNAAEAFKVYAENLAQVMTSPVWVEVRCDECQILMGRIFVKPARGKQSPSLCSPCGSKSMTRVRHGGP